ARRAPSLARELIQAILLKPDLAREVELPRPVDGTPEGAALAALIDACIETGGPLTTPALMQRFAESPHEPILAAALASAEDHELTPEHAEARLRDGAARSWLLAQRAGKAAASEGSPLPPEEVERLRQLEWVRRALPGGEPTGPAERS